MTPTLLLAAAIMLAVVTHALIVARDNVKIAAEWERLKNEEDYEW